MTTNSILFFLIILFLFSGCSPDNDNDETARRINIDLKKNRVKFMSDVIETVKLTKLQSEGAPVIGSTGKILLHGSQIFVQDSQSNQLVVFDTSGNFAHKINGTPAEKFRRLDDFLVDNDTIYILDGAMKELMRYRLDGKYINSQVPPFYAFRFETLDNMFCFRTGSDVKFNIVLTDKNLEIKNEFRRKTVRTNPILAKQLSKNAPSDLVYSEYMKDVVYSITADKLMPKYFFSFNEKSAHHLSNEQISEKFYPQNGKQFNRDSLGNYILGVDLFNESQQFISFLVSNQNNFNAVIYNKQGDTYSVYDSDVINDITYTREPIVFTASDNERFISAIPSYIFKNQTINRSVSYDMISSKRQEIVSEIASQISETSNPIILIAKIKTKI